MTFSSFAGSLLLALTLASLSALAPPARQGPYSTPDQTLAPNTATFAAGAGTRVALADGHAASRLPTMDPVGTRVRIVPIAGEFIPGAEQ